jgi:hypothetical protein
MMRSCYILGSVSAALSLLAAPTRAADPIQRAIDRGVAHLKMLQGPDGTWTYGEHVAGATALAALALLECGTPARDPVVHKAARAIRKASPGLSGTYDLALAIMFFDRLGDPADVPLIQGLGVRLLAGQLPGGGWSYNCREVGGAAETQRLSALLRSYAEPGSQPAAPRRPGGSSGLSPEIQQLVPPLNRTTEAPDPRAGAGGDNSNTQFAVLGLWVAHRHGVPVENALLRTENRFRAAQRPDGGWGYQENQNSTATMTCSGLLGVAMGLGISNEAVLRSPPRTEGEPTAAKPLKVRDPDQDPAIRAGFVALAMTLGQPLPSPGNAFYLLWSIERVAVAYGLKTIGNVNWYTWGSELLLASQRPDGSWQGNWGGPAGADTCFALLFLRRANFARDLTFSLRGKRDPGEVSLRSLGSSSENAPAGRSPKPAPASDAGPALPRLEPPSGRPREADPTAPATTSPEAPALSPAELDRQAARLSNQLLQAPIQRQFALLKEYANAKGVLYTQALATALPQLSGGALEEGRDLLTQRLARMTAETLRDKLQDENREVRRAAALACARKGEKRCVPDLIPLLEDPERAVARAAHQALAQLAGRDFGPTESATPREQAEAVRAWKAWWQKQAR